MSRSAVLIIVSVCIGGSVCASKELGPRAPQSVNQALKLLEQAREEALGISVHNAFYKLDVLLGIAQVYNEMGERALASGVLPEAEALAGELDRSKLYGLLAVGQARAGYLKQALETVKKLPNDSGFSVLPRDYPDLGDLTRGKDTVLNIIIDEQLSKRDVEGALAAAAISPKKSMNGRPRDEAYRKIVLAQWRWGDVPEARRNIKLVSTPWGRDELLRDLIDIQLEGNDIKGAAQFLQRVHYLSNRIPLLIKVAVAQANHGDKKGSKRSFEKAITIASKLIDMKAQLFSEIKALCDIAVGQTQAGDPLAQDTLQRAMKLAEPRIQRGYYADSVLSYLAITQARCGLLQKALNTANSIKDVSRKANTFARVATIQTEVGNVIDAIKNFQKAGDVAGKIKDSWLRDGTLLSIVAECVKSGQPDVGLQLAQRIEFDSERERALLKIVDWYARHGQVKQAEEVRNEIGIKSHYRRRANKSIIYAMVQAGNFSSAFEMAKKMDGPEEGDVMQKLIEGQIKAGDFSGAALTARTWRLGGYTETALGHVATAQARTGDVDGALALVSDKYPMTKAYVWTGAARGIVERIGSN